MLNERMNHLKEGVCLGGVWVFYLSLNYVFTMFQNIVILLHFRLKLSPLTKEGSPAKTLGQEFEMARAGGDKFHPGFQTMAKHTEKQPPLAAPWHGDLSEPFQFPESQNSKKPFHTYLVEYLYSTLNVCNQH